MRGFGEYVIAVSAFILSFAGCTAVDYGYIDYGEDSGVNPDEVGVSLSYSWPSSAGDGISGVNVLMSRIYNEVHYVWTDESAADVDTVAVLGGDYYAIAFGWNNEDYKAIGIEGFRDDASMGMRTVCAGIPEMTKDEIAAEYGKDVNDFNPSLPYIRQAGSLWMGAVKFSALSSEGQKNLNFRMEDLTMTVHLSMKVRTEDNVEVERLSGDLAGTPCRISLMSGIVPPDKSGKVLFDFSKSGQSGNVIVYEASVKVLGLLAPENSTLKTGPGILRITLIAKSGENQRVFYAGINLKNEIENAKVMLLSSDKSGYRKNLSEAYINVGSELKIGKVQIETGGSEAVGGWFENQDINVDL